jgi:hypothetical protein
MLSLEVVGLGGSLSGIQLHHNGETPGDIGDGGRQLRQGRDDSASFSANARARTWDMG